MDKAALKRRLEELTETVNEKKKALDRKETEGPVQKKTPGNVWVRPGADIAPTLKPSLPTKKAAKSNTWVRPGLASAPAAVNPSSAPSTQGSKQWVRPGADIAPTLKPSLLAKTAAMSTGDKRPRPGDPATASSHSPNPHSDQSAVE